jgi:hypothetical protein
MQTLRKILSFAGPVLVIGGLLAFVYYALVLYKPADGLACGNFVQRQADIAVHVIRQWTGKASEDYAGCTANP